MSLINDDSLEEFGFDEDLDTVTPSPASTPTDPPVPRYSFLTGVAGSGKTYQVKQRIETSRPGSIVLSASTGIAALNMGEGVTTVHSLLKFYDYDSLENAYLEGRLTRNMLNLVKDGVRELVIDECFDSPQPILTEHGWKPIGTVVRRQLPIQVWSRNSNGVLELKPIVRWIVHKAPTAMLRIRFGYVCSRREAKKITCTASHKILTPKGYVVAGDLKVGDSVIVRGTKLTPTQFSIIVGGLLGDAGMSRSASRSSPQVRFTQGEAQLDYLKFKHEILGELAAPIKEGTSGYGPNKVYGFNVDMTQDTWRISKERRVSIRAGSKHSQWSPTDKFLSWIDEPALAIWFMDDGTLARKALKISGGEAYHARLDTSQFSEADQFRFIHMLQVRFGLTATLLRYKTNRFTLCFGRKETARLLCLIGPHSPRCMQTKVPTAQLDEAPYQKVVDTCESIVQSIETCAPSSRSVYDIEVADNHNYVAGNVIVSNCSMVSGPMLDLLYQASQEVPQYGESLAISLTGDFLQLPPVKAPFAFEAQCFHEFAANTTRLTKVWRQTNQEFLAALNMLRRGAGGEAAEILRGMGVVFHQDLEDRFEGTTLRAKNDEVDRYNTLRLLGLPGQAFGLMSARWGTPEVYLPAKVATDRVRQPADWAQIPERLAMKVGARVMVLVNDTGSGPGGWQYVNGSTGVVRGLVKGDEGETLVEVELDNGRGVVRIGKVVRRVDRKRLPDEWEGQADRLRKNTREMAMAKSEPYWRVVGSGGKGRWVLGEVEYFPLRLAWASTIHRSQGLTLDRVQVDMRAHFFGAPAMAYVSLSRCKTPEGLRLVGKMEDLRRRANVDPKVVGWL